MRVVLSDGAEKTAIIQVFQKTLGPFRTKATKVERIQNPKLSGPIAGMRETIWSSKARATATRGSGYFKVNPKKLWTRSSLMVPTGHGKGVDFAVHSQYSVDYASPNSRGERHMFLCRILVGELLSGEGRPAHARCSYRHTAL
jgi:hypothetical protein